MSRDNTGRALSYTRVAEDASQIISAPQRGRRRRAVLTRWLRHLVVSMRRHCQLVAVVDVGFEEEEHRSKMALAIATCAIRIFFNRR